MSNRAEKKEAWQHLFTEYIKLYLLPREDKSPAVCARMRFLAAKFQTLS